MSVFNAGSLVWKIQTVGAQLAAREQKELQESFKKAGDAAQGAGTQITESGNATDKTAAKAKNAKGSLDGQADSTKKVGSESKTAKGALEGQAAATEKAGTEAQKAKPKQEEQAKVTEKQAEASKKLAAGLVVAGLAIGALVTLAVVKQTEFGEAMSQVGAATMATRQEQELLAEAALDAGADTAYSASEAANAQEELAKAGMSVTQVVNGGLNGALSLAAAGQLAVARSAEIMATTLTQFQMPAEKAAHVADLLAAGAGKAQGSVEDMGLALSYVGPLANSVGWSIEETAGTIAYFATQGIIGEKAGTALRGVMAGLQAPSSAAQKAMDKYGITVYDAAGKMKSAAGLAEEFKTKLGGLTDQERQAAMGRIFGNESLLAATLLYDGGADAINKWTDEVNDSGYAAEQAAMRQDNLAGDIEKLGGAFDTALIKTGRDANVVLREMVQAVSGLVDIYGEAPGEVQATALVIGVAAAAMLLLAGGTVIARGRFLDLKDQLDKTSVSMRKTALVGAAAGLALTGVITVVALLASAHAEGRAKIQAYADTLDDSNHSITESTREAVASSLAMKDSFLWFESDSGYDIVEKLGLDINEVTEAAMGNETALKSVKEQLDQFRFGAEGAAEKAEALGMSAVELDGKVFDLDRKIAGENNTIKEAIKVAGQLAQGKKESGNATEAAAEQSQNAAGKYLEEAAAGKELNDQLKQLIDTLFESNDLNRDAITSSNDYKEAMMEVDEVIRKATEGVDENNDGIADYSLTLDKNSLAGIDNMNMLIGLAESGEAAAEANFKASGNTDDLKASLEASHQAIMDRAIAFGYNEAEARELADTIAGIPSESAWKIITDTQAAQDGINSFLWANRQHSISVKIRTEGYVALPSVGSVVMANGGHVEFYRDGGHRHENHVAQMARAGAMRVWAEPETGGETYIPHAESKRARSTQILSETADMFGYELVPKNASRFADGAPSVISMSQVPKTPSGGAQIVFVNPVVRDLMADAWAAAQIVDKGGVF